MLKNMVIEKSNLYFDFGKKQIAEVLKHCPVDKKVTLTMHDQIKLFGAPLTIDGKTITVLTKHYGIAIFQDNDSQVSTMYSWHGLITPILKSLFHFYG